MSVEEIISRILGSLPMGFGFHPTDEQLVVRYLIPKLRDEHSRLKMKIPGTDFQVDIIREVDVCQWEPGELPDELYHPVFSVLQTDDPEWFFFSPLHKKNGSQFKRATNKGFWKSTGPDRKIKHRATGKDIGTKKTLVFHEGRGPSAVSAGWIIHEYHADKKFVRDDETYVLCRLKRETGSGFPPQTNLNGKLPNPPSNQQTWLMNMDVDDSSTGTGIHLNGPPNIVTSGADRSHYANNIASDPRNYLPNDMTPEEYALLDRPLFDYLGFDSDGYLCEIRSAVDSGNLGHCFIGRLLTCPQTPLKGTNGKGGGSSSDTDTEVLQVQYSQSRKTSSLINGVSHSKHCMPSPMARRSYATSQLSSINQHRKENKSSLHDESRRFAAPSIERLDNFVAQRVAPKSVKLEGNVSKTDIPQALTKLSCSMSKSEEKPVSTKAKEMTEYDSATDHNKDSIKESKKDCEVTQKANVKLSPKSIWNVPVGSNQKGFFNCPETASVSHEQSSSPDYLVNLLVGMLLFVILIAVMVLDINAKVSKPLQ